jgi:hypothetical protein
MAPTLNGEKTNGSNVVDSITPTKPKSPVDSAEMLSSLAKPRPAPPKPTPTKADKQGVANAFERHGQLLHARVKPLPHQNGAGTFYETERWGKLRNDIKSLRAAGMLTADAQERGWTLMMHTRFQDAQGHGRGQDQGREDQR